MTRFVYIADTHLGASGEGFQQQPRAPERLAELLAWLRRWIEADGAVDFIVHGGDMIDRTSADAIRAARGVFDLGVPLRLCLGNHDLTERGAADEWLRLAPEFFGGDGPGFAIDTPDCRLRIEPVHWCDEPFVWIDRQDVQWTAAQVAALEGDLNGAPGRPKLLVTHSPVFGAPGEQTGLAAPFHPAPDSFLRQVTGLAARCPELACVLGAHNHLNMHVECAGVHYATVSSFVETPFEFKLFAIAEGVVRMRTVALPAEGGPVPYDESRGFVQGRSCDRTFAWRMPSD